MDRIVLSTKTDLPGGLDLGVAFASGKALSGKVSVAQGKMLLTVKNKPFPLELPEGVSPGEYRISFQKNTGLIILTKKSRDQIPFIAKKTEAGIHEPQLEKLIRFFGFSTAVAEVLKTAYIKKSGNNLFDILIYFTSGNALKKQFWTALWSMHGRYSSSVDSMKQKKGSFDKIKNTIKRLLDGSGENPVTEVRTDQMNPDEIPLQFGLLQEVKNEDEPCLFPFFVIKSSNRGDWFVFRMEFSRIGPCCLIMSGLGTHAELKAKVIMQEAIASEAAQSFADLPFVQIVPFQEVSELQPDSILERILNDAFPEFQVWG